MPDELVSRRKFVGGCGVVIISGLSGCGNPDAGPFRKLLFRDVSVQETGDDWLATFEIVNSSRARDEFTTFHDVRVHGYSRDQAEVGMKHLGTVSDEWHEGNRMPVEMTCTGFPTMFTFSAQESPCDDEVRTVLAIAVYDDEHGWTHDRHSRDCGEGLPPEPRN